jgi:hypothetical protein
MKSSILGPVISVGSEFTTGKAIWLKKNKRRSGESRKVNSAFVRIVEREYRSTG